MSVDPTNVAVSLIKYGFVQLYKRIKKKGKSIAQKKDIQNNVQIRDEDVIVVLQLGRMIVDDVENWFGRVDYVISNIGEINPEDFASYAVEAYLAVQEANRLSHGARIILVLSGPVVVNFMLGQYIGLSHFDIHLAYWNKGKYQVVQSADRSLLQEYAKKKVERTEVVDEEELDSQEEL